MRSTRNVVSRLALFVLLGIAGLAASTAHASSTVAQPTHGHQYDAPAPLSPSRGAPSGTAPTPAANLPSATTVGRPPPSTLRAGTHVSSLRIVAAEGLPDDVASTFRGGRYTARTLQNDTTYYRAGTAGKPYGQFFSDEPPVSEIQTRIDKAIPPEWPDGSPAPVDTGYAINIPAGTTVYEGDVASQGGWYMGGTGQTYIPHPWDIPGANVLDSLPLQ